MCKSLTSKPAPMKIATCLCQKKKSRASNQGDLHAGVSNLSVDGKKKRTRSRGLLRNGLGPEICNENDGAKDKAVQGTESERGKG